MYKRLSKYGNNLALIIDKPILELLNIKEDTLLKVTTDGKSIIVIPLDGHNDIDKISERPDVQKSFESVVKEYAPALKKLVDS